jgi:1-acyl-sn-glycerol-3-phosphate acyltransferase
MSKMIVDKKSKISMAFFTWLNKVVQTIHFDDVQMVGLENIPRTGPFLAIANHQSRWDGLMIYRALGRVVNVMVSPNELLGLQGAIIRSCGGFPADSRFALMQYIEQRIEKGEGIVIFPEGNTFRDGVIHPFKDGAARVAVMCYERGVDLPIIPIAIDYNGNSVRLSVSKPVNFRDACLTASVKDKELIKEITRKLQEKVTADREALRRTPAFLPLNPRPILEVGITFRRSEIA